MARVEALEEAASTMLLAALGDILAPISRNLGSREALTAAVNPAEARVSLDDLAAISPRWGMAVDEVVLPWFGGVFEAGGAAAQAQLAGIGVVVPAPDPELMNYAARNYLADARPRFTRLGDQAWNNARAELVAGFQAGEGIGALRARVRRAEDLTRSEADRMARTEVISASNAGAVADVELLGDDAPPYRQWLSTLDSRTRPTHVRADGQVIKAGDTFQVGTARLRFPGDPSGPAHEVMQCRCTILFLDDPTPIEPEGRQQGGVTETAEGAQGDIGGPVDIVAEAADVKPSGVTVPALPGPQNAPGGAPVSTSMYSVSMDVDPVVERAAAAIDSVHGDGNLNTIKIGRMSPREIEEQPGTNGYFRPDNQVGGSHIGVRLGKPGGDGSVAESTVLHEVGHWLDFAAIGDPATNVPGGYWYASGGEGINSASQWAPMSSVFDAIRGSDAYRKLDGTRGFYESMAANTDNSDYIRSLYRGRLQFAEYMQSDVELWARAYAQYITDRADDQLLKDQLATLRSRFPDDLPGQWSEEDFAPIADAMDKFFTKIGWRT